MKTLLGYASIALAVLGVIGYALRPAARTMPWYKFAGAVAVMLGMGIGLIVIDAKEEGKLASVPAKGIPEAPLAPSPDKEILAQVLRNWKDAYGLRDGAFEMWINMVKANFESRELDAARFTSLEALVSQYKGECDRFLKLQSDIQKIRNKVVQQNAQGAMALSTAHCKSVLDLMVATMSAVSPEVLKASERTVGQNANAAMQVHSAQLALSNEAEYKAVELFSAALAALGMNPDLKSY